MTDTDGESMIVGKMAWTPAIELMLAKWCDESKCFEWMHTEAFGYYDKRARIIAIASNVLTAVCGLSNVIAGGSSVNGFQLSWAFGSLSIVVSITNMLQEKLAYAIKATQHNNFAVQWGSIRRKIEEEILIPPESRKDCKTFLKYLRQDVNQVSIDGNAMIPEFIRRQCYEKFKDVEEFDIPDICGKIEHTKVYIKDLLNSTTDTNSGPEPISPVAQGPLIKAQAQATQAQATQAQATQAQPVQTKPLTAIAPNPISTPPILIPLRVAPGIPRPS